MNGLSLFLVLVVEVFEIKAEFVQQIGGKQYGQRSIQGKKAMPYAEAGGIVNARLPVKVGNPVKIAICNWGLAPMLFQYGFIFLRTCLFLVFVQRTPDRIPYIHTSASCVRLVRLRCPPTCAGA